MTPVTPSTAAARCGCTAAVRPSEDPGVEAGSIPHALAIDGSVSPIMGDAAQSVAAVNRIVASDFRDPEGLFYLARHLSHLQQVTPALEVFERVVEGGFFCFPAITHDPWLEPLRRKPSFTKRLRQAETQHRKTAAAFAELRGAKVLGVRA